MPLDLVKRHMRTMGSSHDINVASSALAGLCSNWRIKARNLGSRFTVPASLLQVNQMMRASDDQDEADKALNLYCDGSYDALAVCRNAPDRLLHVRVDEEIKTQASEALAAMGLSVSGAARILLKRVVNDQAFPLKLKVPNAKTRAAIEEARAIAKARTTRFDSADALIDGLEKARWQ